MSPKFAERVALLDDAPDARLEALNERVLEKERRRIRAKRDTPERLRARLLRLAGRPGREEQYDALDVLAAGLLPGTPPDCVPPCDTQMYGYQPTPARTLLRLLDEARVGPQDTFLDVGSGHGVTAIFTALVTGARVRGIELEPAYTAYAQQAARALRLRHVSFLTANAHETPLDDATVVFLYSPFVGAKLDAFVQRIPRTARVLAYGPCAAQLGFSVRR